jgi:hypothetical protein
MPSETPSSPTTFRIPSVFQWIAAVPIDDGTVRMLEAAAIAVIGFFTGKQVINPQKLDAAWKSLTALAEDITHGQT